MDPSPFSGVITGILFPAWRASRTRRRALTPSLLSPPLRVALYASALVAGYPQAPAGMFTTQSGEGRSVMNVGRNDGCQSGESRPQPLE
jgi:hypothetical protein